MNRHLFDRCWITISIVTLTATTVLAGVKDKRLDVYWVDVEGGAATLIVTPAGESVLIDTGNAGTRDPGRIVKLATQVAGLTKLDHVIITHYHGDHYGGAAMLAKLLSIERMYDNGEFEGQPNFPSKEYQDLKCGQRIVINPGDQLKLKQAPKGDAAPVFVRCLGTRKQFISAPDSAANDDICAAHKPKDRDGSDNANSVVSLIGFGAFRFFIAGDLTWNQEQRLVCPVNLVGEVDVYQVTHHGLDSSNNPIVLRSLAPRVAIMNNGVTKGCAPEVFANLKAAKSLEAIYQLHKNERPDGRTNNVAAEFIANHGKDNCQGHYVHLSVDPTGGRYIVNVPSTGHLKAFNTKGR